MTWPIWKSVEIQLHCNPIDLKSVGLHRAGTIYRSNRIHTRTKIRLDQWTLLPVFHSRAKHIDLHHHFICKAIQDRIIWVQYIPIAEIMADSLTKALGGEKHEKCTVRMGMAWCLDVSGSLLSSPFSFLLFIQLLCPVSLIHSLTPLFILLEDQCHLHSSMRCLSDWI